MLHNDQLFLTKRKRVNFRQNLNGQNKILRIVSVSTLAFLWKIHRWSFFWLDCKTLYILPKVFAIFRSLKIKKIGKFPKGLLARQKAWGKYFEGHLSLLFRYCYTQPTLVWHRHCLILPKSYCIGHFCELYLQEPKTAALLIKPLPYNHNSDVSTGPNNTRQKPVKPGLQQTCNDASTCRFQIFLVKDQYL